MTRGSWVAVISLVTSLVALGGPGAGTAWSADCGDRAGPQRSRVACACGDTVVTSTRLRSSDPVVQDVCPDHGLIIGADRITLDCRNRTLTGDGDDFEENGIMLIDRSKVTIKNCRITAFADAIQLNGSEESKGSNRNTIVKNKLFDNIDDGIDLNDSSDRNFLGWNRTTGNGSDGIDLDSDSDWNVIKANFSSGNAFQGIEDCVECNNNTYLFNVLNRTGDDEGDGQGLMVNGRDNLFLGNRGSHNNATGLLVTGEGNVLKRNIFNRNGGDGICAVSGNTDAGGNRGRHNADADVAFDQVSCPTNPPFALAAAASARADDDE